jgi:hypothetical protein
MIRQFAEHIGTLDTGGDPCRSIGILQQILMRKTNFPGRGKNPFSGGSALAEMMLDMSDNQSGEGDLKGKELLGLDKTLNGMKAAVFDRATSVFTTPSKLTEKLAKVTRFAALWNYLSDAKFAKIFRDTSKRIRATMKKLDDEVTSSTMTNKVWEPLNTFDCAGNGYTDT